MFEFVAAYLLVGSYFAFSGMRCALRDGWPQRRIARGIWSRNGLAALLTVIVGVIVVAWPLILMVCWPRRGVR